MTIETFPTVEAWADACASRLASDLLAAVTANGRALFAGPGGSTPSPIYARLAQADLDWSKVAVTLIDERYVPETSPESNARLIRDVLMTGPAAAARFIPLYQPAVTVDRAAAMAAAALKSEGGRFEAVLLGMGRGRPYLFDVPRQPDPEDPAHADAETHGAGGAARRDGAAPTIERLSVNLAYLMGAGRVILR